MKDTEYRYRIQVFRYLSYSYPSRQYFIRNAHANFSIAKCPEETNGYKIIYTQHADKEIPSLENGQPNGTCNRGSFSLTNVFFMIVLYMNLISYSKYFDKC